MRLTRIEIENFRGFERFELDLPPEGPTVLIGKNGAGKTSLLRAIGIITNVAVRNGYLAELNPTLDYDHPADSRIAWTESGGVIIERRVGRPRIHGHFSTGATEAFARFHGSGNPGADASGVDRSSDVLPMFARLEAHRKGKLLYPKSPKPSGPQPREIAYQVSSSLTNSLSTIAQWHLDQHYVRLDRLHTALAAGNSSHVSEIYPQLSAFETASACLLQGATRVRYVPELNTLVVDTDGRSKPYSFLSDGQRALIALGLGLVWQAVVLNPQLLDRAPAETPGVVLIDEPELHLHPQWQWTLLDRLQTAFPKVQFIVATHSPTIVTAAPADAVRVITPTQGLSVKSYGRDVQAIVAEIFGAPIRREETTKQLEELSDHLDHGRTDDARRLLEQIETVLGLDDPDVIRARWTLKAREQQARRAKG